MDHLRIKDEIVRRFQNLTFIDRSTANELHLEFDTDGAKEFYFYVWVDAFLMSANFGARLRSNPDAYFWYESVEQLDTNREDWNQFLINYFAEYIGYVKNNKTRIIQRDGIFCSSFTGQYFDSNWKTLYRNRGLRWTLTMPRITGFKRVYE